MRAPCCRVLIGGRARVYVCSDMSNNRLSGPIDPTLYFKLEGLQMCKLAGNPFACPIAAAVAQDCGATCS